MEEKKFEWLSLTKEEIDKSFDLTKVKVLKDTGLKGLIEIKTKEQLLALVKSYQLLNQIKKEDEYFISKNHRLAYHLLNIDRPQSEIYEKELEITRVHYKEKSLAKDWKRKMSKIFHPDRSNFKFDVQDVMSSVNNIYKRLVGEA
ncbi:hypothetical protein NUK47_10750 [Aeromonas hydrophila]|uniref:hypothetical protein n=1 Tax=Aeromonas hydrophila TaxID=644 RepID=UPI00214D8101|nr:hypothetical protein [Aeromonas hydrophila]MCR3909252.1 hypothetical protein [Aeromonas hydrophila]